MNAGTLISGNLLPVESPGENVPLLIETLAKDHLNMDVPRSAISTAHRLGQKKPNLAQDKRPIIVKLCQRDLKRDLIREVRKLPRGSHSSSTKAQLHNAKLL